MILDTPLVTRLALGSGKMVPELGDSQLRIPAVGALILPLIGPVVPVQPSVATFQNESFYCNSGDVRNNQAATNGPVCAFAKGLWDIEIVWALSWSGAAYNGNLGNFLRFDVAGTTSVNIGIIPINVVPVVISFRRKFDILFQNDTTLTVGSALTAVGDFLITQVMVIANRRI